jgi:hypothetical protein
MHAAIAAEDDGDLGQVAGLQRVTSKDIRARQPEGLEDTVVFVRMKDSCNAHGWIVKEGARSGKLRLCRIIVYRTVISSMSHLARVACWTFCFVVLGSAVPSSAGALPPCTKAVTSKNGKFLVITTAQLVPWNENSFRAERVSLDVFPKEKFINAKDRVDSGESYWSDSVQWSVILDKSKPHPVPPCPMPLISDDGEFLIILNEGVTNMGIALRIYRRRDHPGEPLRTGPDHGVLVREVPIRDLWPKSEIPHLQVITDETPQWFAGGKLDFSADNRYLFFTTRFRTTVRIDLQNGSVKTTLDLRLEGIPE